MPADTSSASAPATADIGRRSQAPGYRSQGFELVGYHDLGGSAGFKLAMQVVGDRWYLYTGHFWDRYASVLDVTDPTRPDRVGVLELPDDPTGLWTLQVQVADGLLVVAVEDPPDKVPTQDWSGEGGFLVFDVREPAAPRPLGRWRSGGRGTHRNYYAGGRYVFAAANVPGLYANALVVVDISDPASPEEAGRFWLPEQDLSTGRPDRHYSLHGPAHVDGDRAYLPYGHGGLVILDVADPTRPTQVSRLDFGPAWGSRLGVHTALPLPDRNLVVVNTEAIEERCQEPLNFAVLVDVTDETAPRVVSMLPLPAPPPDAPYPNFSHRGGRFGPHNQHHHNHLPFLLHDDQMVYLTYFNAGLRLFDISDPLLPREVAWYLPDDPTTRRGPLPATALTSSSEDVLVDVRGYVYLTDKNHGLQILRRTGGDGGR
jgi:hypothetical protein